MGVERWGEGEDRGFEQRHQREAIRTHSMDQADGDIHQVDGREVCIEN